MRHGVDLIFRIAAVGLAVALLNQLLIRSGREEQALLTTLAGLIVVLFMLLDQIRSLFEKIHTVFGF
ncbi:MAG: stage III sporulation protein AC [Clostridia bacterium]|nr:stage III sporulation protein AC [Clostridia bacterium]